MNNSRILTVDIERDMPSVEKARKQLLQIISDARNRKITALKIIHGYGSSGVGGELRVALRKSLSRRRKEGLVKAFVFGENWDPFSSAAREIMDHCPELRRDSDLAKYNPGITLVLL